MNRHEATQLYEVMMVALLASAEWRLEAVASDPRGLSVGFTDGHRAVIQWADLTMPGSAQAVCYEAHTPTMVTCRSRTGFTIRIGADALRTLSNPGGRATFESELRAQHHVVDKSVNLLRENLGMAISAVAARSGLPAQLLVDAEAGHPVSEWDLNRISVALDAYVPDILCMQQLLTARDAQFGVPRQGNSASGN